MGQCFGQNVELDKTNNPREAQYINEIFDGLDTNGTQTLSKHELPSIWVLYKEKSIKKLEEELKTFIEINKQNVKTFEEENTKLLEQYKTINKNKITEISEADSDYLLKNRKKINIKEFRKIMQFLKLSEEEMQILWKTTKENEIIAIQNSLKKNNT